MLIYAENKYKVEIIDNAKEGEFVLAFKEKPEDLVFHLLRALGFVDRSLGKEFVQSYDAELRIFADQFQKAISRGCFPKFIPYEAAFEQSEQSINNFDFSIVSVQYRDSKGSTQEYEFLIFERIKSRRNSLAYLIAFLKHGDDLMEVKTSYRVRRKEALKLFKKGEYVVQLPQPFGAGCPPLYAPEQAGAQYEITSTNTLSEARLEVGETNGENQRTNISLNARSNVRANAGLNEEVEVESNPTAPQVSEEINMGLNAGANVSANVSANEGLPQGINEGLNRRSNGALNDQLAEVKPDTKRLPAPPASKGKFLPPENLSEQIQLKQITLSGSVISDDQNENQIFDNWSSANEQLQQMIGQFPNAHYRITWVDGFEINGRMDLEPADYFKESQDLLSKHLEYFYWNLSKSEANPIIPAESITFAQKLLSDYTLTDLPRHSKEKVVQKENDPIQKEKAAVQKKSGEQVARPEQLAPIAQPYTEIYMRLHEVIPDAIKHIEEGKTYQRSKVEGFMDLIFEFLYQDEEERYIISLSHYFEQEGDLVADPDMEIRIDPTLQTAEALSYQDQGIYQQVYHTEDDTIKVNPVHKKQLNRFLKQWLKNLIDQGHLIDLSTVVPEKEKEEKESKINTEQETNEPLTDSIELFDFHEAEFNQAVQEKDREIAYDKLMQMETLLREKFKPDYITRILPLIAKSLIKYKLKKEKYSFQSTLTHPSFVKKLSDNFWKFLAGEQKSIALPKKISWDAYPYDLGLQNLLKDFPEEAENPDYRGVLFDEYGIMATDIICLIFLARPTDGKHGYFCMTRKCWEKQGYNWKAVKDRQKALLKKGHGNFYNKYLSYQTQLREKHHIIVSVNTADLYQKLQLIQKYFLHYPDQAVLLKFEKEFLPLNVYKLSKVLKAMIQLGHQELDLCYRDKKSNLTLVPEGNADLVPSYQTDFALLMPIVFENSPQKGSLYYDTGSQSIQTIGIEPIQEEIATNQSKRATTGVPVQSITLSETVFQEEPMEHYFENWVKADGYFQRLLPYIQNSGSYITLSVLWDNGMELDQLKVFANLPYLLYHEKPVLGGIAASLLLHQIHLGEGRIPGEKKNDQADLPTLHDSLQTLDFGGDINFMTHKQKPKIPIQSINIESGTSKRLNTRSYQPWEVFAKASGQLESAGALIGKEEKINLSLHWVDGKVIQSAISPIHIPSKVNDKFWVDWINEQAGKDALPYQKSDGDALLEVSEVNPSKKTVFYEKLLSAYQRESDDQSDSISIDGITYQRERLLKVLTEQLFSLPQDQWKKILTNYAKQFKLLDQFQFIGQSKAKAPAALERLETKAQDVLRSSLLSVGEHSSGNRLLFIIQAVGNLDHQMVDLPRSIEKSTETDKTGSTAPTAGKRLKLNQEIEAFIDQKKKENGLLTPKEIEWIGKYSGYGGIHTESPNPGSLYEYYTPLPLIKKMWDLTYHFGYEGGDVLEPAAGNGRFLTYAPKDSRVVAYEINPYAAFICQKTYPHAIVYKQAFESLFFEGNRHLKGNFTIAPFQLIIGNPPYGEFKGKYAGMGERKYTIASEYDQYFITRGLDVLSPGGLLVYLISSYFLNSKKAYQKVKKKIAEKAELIYALRLPNGSVDYTDVGTDIIIFKKR